MYQQIGRNMWYDRLSTEQDRVVQRSCAEWLNTYPWQIYFTFTFAYPAARALAERQMREFLNRLERHYRNPIGMMFAEETRSWSGCGEAAVPLHYHGLLCSDARLEPGAVETGWHSLGHFAGNAKASRYDAAGNAAYYCLKSLREPGSNWNLLHLDFFTEETGPSNHAARRRQQHRACRLSTPCQN
jgi:hypothetical protein